MNLSTHIRRILLGAGLALAALAPAALGGPAADAQAPPTLSPLRVQASGTEATVSFTSSEPVALTITHQPTGAPISQSRAQVQSAYTSAPVVKLTGLTSDTAYTVIITGRTRDNRTATAQTTFATAKKRIRITLESIDITNDGDWIGDGEPSWVVFLKYAGGSTSGCFPRSQLGCEQGKYGEGRFTPLNAEGKSLQFVLAEENFDRFPETVSLSATAIEEDSSLGLGLQDLVECIANAGCSAGEDSPTVWRVPQGEEFAHQILAIDGVDTKKGFRSVLNFSVVLYHDDTPYPVAGRNAVYSTWGRNIADSTPK